MKRFLFISVMGATVFAPKMNAEVFFSNNSISYLKNLNDFEVLTNDDINVFTFEHVSAHHWGDAFFFVDRINADEDSQNAEFSETYGEASVRFSLSNLLDTDLDNEVIKDYFIATTYEFSSNTFGSFDNYLIGLGASWNLPGFAFFNTNIYQANNEEVDNDTQLTVTYGYPFSIGEQNFMIDGYIDWSSSADDHKADFHFNPQLRWDVWNNFGKPNFVELGVEYSYWVNKYGIQGLDDESTVSALVKIHM